MTKRSETRCPHPERHQTSTYIPCQDCDYRAAAHTTPPPNTQVQSETLEQIADRLVDEHDCHCCVTAEALTASYAKLRADVLSALRNERERANDVLKPVRKCLAKLRKNARTDGQFYSIHLGLMDIRELNALIDTLNQPSGKGGNNAVSR